MNDPHLDAPTRGHALCAPESSTSSTRRAALVAPLVLVAALLLGGCSDDSGVDAGAGETSTSTSTTVDPADADAAELELDAVTFGNTFLAGDAATLRPLMTARCQELLTEQRTEVMLGLVLGAMERQQDVDAEDVVVRSALAGTVEGTEGEAALVLNSEAFDDPSFAFLQMQPYVFEDGEWRFDGCDTLKVDLGQG